jgi:hypothetical protein
MEMEGSAMLSREKPLIQPRQTVDLMGSSELPTVRTVGNTFGHLSHPGNSNAQNSRLKGASAAVISKPQFNFTEST